MDAAKNIVYITHGYTGADHRRDTFDVADINWIGAMPRATDALHVKVRHGAHLYGATVTPQGTNAAHVVLDDKDQAITPGQYAVFYADRECLGGGVIV